MSKVYVLKIKSKKGAKEELEYDRFYELASRFGFEGAKIFGREVKIVDDGSRMDDFLMLVRRLENVIGKATLEYTIRTGEIHIIGSPSDTSAAILFIEMPEPSSDVSSLEDDFHGFYESDFYVHASRIREGKKLITRKVPSSQDEYLFVKYVEKK